MANRHNDSVTAYMDCTDPGRNIIIIKYKKISRVKDVDYFESDINISIRKRYAGIGTHKKVKVKITQQ